MPVQRKPSRVKARYLVLGALVVAVICCFVLLKAMPRVQEDLDARASQEEMDSKRVVVQQGETAELGSESFSYQFAGYEENPFGWTGTLKVTILSADLYDSWEDAPLKSGPRTGVFNKELLKDGAADPEATRFLLCKVRIHNVDAVPLENDEREKGYLLASFAEPAVSNELEYLYCKDEHVFSPHHPEYVLVSPGSTRTFVFGWSLYGPNGAFDASSLKVNFDQDALASCALNVNDHR